MTQEQLCRTIATAAHAAKGQKRADGITPYITHPHRVRDLTLSFGSGGYGIELVPKELNNARCAAWLHDVLEDTRITQQDLEDMGVEYRVRELVQILTKENKPHEPESPLYWQNIAHDDTACIIKCADRCSNLEDALLEVKRSGNLKRWRNYVESTRRDVIPIYKSLPVLRQQLQDRLTDVDQALFISQYGGAPGFFDAGNGPELVEV